ncbi:MAG: hypothetical protein AAF266_05550 [Planctomycetota bacterium]
MAATVPENARTRPLTVFAQDPSIEDSHGKPLVTTLEIPAERLAPGPCGYRVRVVDYDASTGTLYEPLRDPTEGPYIDEFADEDPERLIENPHFHQQNVYAIAMRVLSRFELALGRRVGWQFETHQLKIVPHAFREANAFYSRADEALLFGYFAGANSKPSETRSGRIYTCLSHDIVAHETTHALLDGVRQLYQLPSLPDQAALHEGLSDLVAILSAASVADLVEQCLENEFKRAEADDSTDQSPRSSSLGSPEERSADDHHIYDQVKRRGRYIQVTEGETLAAGEALRPDLEWHRKEARVRDDDSISVKQAGLRVPLLSLASQMGSHLSGVRGQALRHSLTIEPDPNKLEDPAFQNPHRRGELLVAATLRALLQVAQRRCFKLGIDDPPGKDTLSSTAETKGGKESKKRWVSFRQLAECLAEAADSLLTISIRALDYVTPVHVTLGGYLAGMLTADYELVGNDTRYEYRRHLREAFAAYGIRSKSDREDGVWPAASESHLLRLTRINHHAMMSNPDEMFRFLWENRHALGISDAYYTRVTSVNPTVRIGPDGLLLQETLVEYVQSAKLTDAELVRRGFCRPDEFPPGAKMDIYGGGLLIFDARGTLKYHIRTYLDDRRAQNERLRYMRGYGLLQVNDEGLIEDKEAVPFSDLHEQRASGAVGLHDHSEELW